MFWVQKVRFMRSSTSAKSRGAKPEQFDLLRRHVKSCSYQPYQQIYAALLGQISLSSLLQAGSN